MVEVGDKVAVPHLGNAQGTVRYIGSVHYAKGDDWVGIELRDAVGKNNGTVKGKSYFTCADKRGVFARLSTIVPVVEKEVAENCEEERLSAPELKSLGNERFGAKDFAGAIQCYSMAIQSDESNAILFGNRAACHLETNAFEEALNDSKKAISLNQEWWKAHSRQAKALEGLGRFQDAARAYRIAADLVTDMNQRKDLIRLAESCLRTNQEPEWLSEIPAEVAEQARANPEFMEMLKQEMQNAERMEDPSFSSPLIPVEASNEDSRPRFQKPVMLVLDLHEAVKAGNREEVDALLAKESASVNELDSHGRSALAWACQRGDVEIAKLLLDHGAIVNPGVKCAQSTSAGKKQDDEEGEDDDTAIPLIFAVRSGSIEIVDLLLKEGADIGVVEPILGHNVLHEAVKRGSIPMIEFLMERAGQPLANKEDFREISPFALACTVNFQGDRKQLLESMMDKGAIVDAGALFAALSKRSEDPDLLNLFQTRFPEANVASDPPVTTLSIGGTMLHLAVRVPKEDKMKEHLEFLLSNGLKSFIDFKNNAGFTCLGSLCNGPRPFSSILQLLLEAGADPNIPQGPEGNRCLHLVGSEGIEQAWNTLREFGADPELTNNAGEPPKLAHDLPNKCLLM